MTVNDTHTGEDARSDDLLRIAEQDLLSRNGLHHVLINGYQRTGRTVHYFTLDRRDNGNIHRDANGQPVLVEHTTELAEYP